MFNLVLPLFKEKDICREEVEQETRIQNDGFRTVTQTLNNSYFQEAIDIKNRWVVFRLAAKGIKFGIS